VTLGHSVALTSHEANKIAVDLVNAEIIVVDTVNKNGKGV